MLVMITAAGVVLIVLALLFILITVAIRAEDSHATAMVGPPPNCLARAARRVTGLHVRYAIPQGRPGQIPPGTIRAHGRRR
jgi:hypothetical protein